MKSGIVTGREVKKNKDGENDVLLLQVEITDSEDVQTIELVTQAGQDINPPDGSIVFINKVGDAWKIAVAVNDNIAPSMNEGEQKIYSSNSGGIQAFINFLNTGILEINGNSDFAVRFNALEIGFNQLRTDFNTFITTVHDLHSHPTAPAGPVSVPSILGTPSTASIASAKINTVKVP